MLTRTEIVTWLAYWQFGKQVVVSRIKTLEDVATARTFCAVMRSGVFTDVTDEQIMDAINHGGF